MLNQNQNQNQDQDQDQDQDQCTICQDRVKDEIKMTCEASHSFCFKCILQDVETHGLLKPCPNCRNGLKFILMLNKLKNDVVNNVSDPFYSTKYFEECLPILNKIVKDNGQKSCLISEEILLLYIKNKKQLKIAKQFNIEEVFDTIKWVKPIKSTSNRGGLIDITNIMNGLQGPQQGPPQGSPQVPRPVPIPRPVDLTEIGTEYLTNFFINELFPHITRQQ